MIRAVLFVKTILLLACHFSFGQQGQPVHISVIDSATRETLPYAHVIQDDTSGYITDLKGSLSICVHPNDTLRISYLGYHEDTLVLRKKHLNRSPLIIPMKVRACRIDHVVVRPYDSWSEFRGAFLDLSPGEPFHQQVHQNVSRTLQQPPGIRNRKISYDISDPVTGPPQIILISSDPQKGFIGFVQELVNNAR